MVEAMYERSPAYFKQFQKKFRFFFVSDEKPSSLFARNYAECMHFENGYCEVLPSNHYHVLFDVSDVSTEILKQNKLYAVPFLVCTQPSKLCFQTEPQWRELEKLLENSNWLWNIRVQHRQQKETQPQFRSGYQI